MGACSRETPTQQEPLPRAESGEIAAAQPADAPSAKVKEVPAGARRRPARPIIVDVDDRTDLTEEDKTFLKAIDKALDDEDFKALQAIAADASKSKTVEVRSELVDALGWFGTKAMAELTPLMADANEDVAQSALDNWTSALDDIENEDTKCALVEGVMSALKNPEMLESLVMEMNGCEDRRVIQTLVNLIGGNNVPAAQAAREHYEFVTGDEFTTIEAAEKWLRENADEE